MTEARILRRKLLQAQRNVRLLLATTTVLILALTYLGLYAADQAKSAQALAAALDDERKAAAELRYEAPPEAPAEELTSLGDFTITFYDLSVESCGKTPDHPAYGITKSGARVQEGITVAVDPEVIPLGSYIFIKGLGYYTAQDTGSAVKGNIIDVYVEDMQTGYDLGGKLTDVEVYLIEEGV